MNASTDFGTPSHMLYRASAGATSADAADSIEAASGSIERRVLLVISHHEDGCTQDQVLAALPGLSYPTVTARFPALLRRKYIEEVDGVTRPGRSGRQQRVVKITAAGLAALTGE